MLNMIKESDNNNQKRKALKKAISDKVNDDALKYVSNKHKKALELLEDD